MRKLVDYCGGKGLETPVAQSHSMFQGICMNCNLTAQQIKKRRDRELRRRAKAKKAGTK